jgi:hypothetical protein
MENIKIAIGGRKEVLDQRLIAIYKDGYQSYLAIVFRILLMRLGQTNI